MDNGRGRGNFKKDFKKKEERSFSGNRNGRSFSNREKSYSRDDRNVKARAVRVSNKDEMEEGDNLDDTSSVTNNLPTDDRLEGKNAVTEAFNAGREINKIWILKPNDNAKLEHGLYKILCMAQEKKIVVNHVPRQTLDRMSQTHNHQGIIAQVASHEYSDVSDMINNARAKGHEPLFVVLDELKDSYNLGSILRIADSAGVDGILIPKHRSIGLDSVVAKASAGAIEYVPVARVTNLTQTLNELKEQGFWVMGTDADAEVDYDKADYSGALAIIIGSEGEGMRNTIKNCCDYLISIPMVGHVNSLNAAVAGGIIVYEAVRQRRLKG